MKEIRKVTQVTLEDIDSRPRPLLFGHAASRSRAGESELFRQKCCEILANYFLGELLKSFEL